ncbi:MAG: helix-hairpin-helix domain-containing protein [Ruminococcus sp.]|nr:helix-hairpin-helix domain-containing protein [Ruminococcus sp.]
MSNKPNKDTILIVSAGLILAGSAVWNMADNDSRENSEIIITSEAENKTVVSTSETICTTEAVHTSRAQTTTIQPSTEFLLLDLNTASADELVRLNGIGEKLAAEIVSYRSENGRFLNIEELMNVSGIGEATFSDIREHIYVTDPIYTTTEPQEITKDDTEPEPPSEEAELTLEEAAPININTADIELLVLLPHVDEAVAEEVMDLRERLGHFSNTYELLYVESLTQSETSDILEYVTVEDE